MTTAPTQKQSETLTPCWYVKDFADGWIKFYDVYMAIAEAKASGAIMRYSENGAYPERAQPSETSVAEKVREYLYEIAHMVIEVYSEDVSAMQSMADEALALLSQNNPASAMSASTDTSASLNEQAETADAPERGALIDGAALLSFVHGMKKKERVPDWEAQSERREARRKGHNAACDTIIAEIEKMMKGGA